MSPLPRSDVDPRRRELLRRGALWTALAGCGLPVVAAEAGDLPIASGSIDEALKALRALPASDLQVRLTVPDVSENGAVVPVSVESTLRGVSDIYLVVDTNPDPVVVRFQVPPGTEPFVATRIKVAESGHVCALVRADGGLYATYRAAKVTVSGCG